MLKATISKELVIYAADEIGTLARLSKALSEKGVNVLAMATWVEDGRGIIRLVTDDHLRSTEALADGYQIEEAPVVSVRADHKPGILRGLTETLAYEQINIEYLYASADIDQAVCFVVLNTSDNERAMILLND